MRDVNNGFAPAYMAMLSLVDIQKKFFLDSSFSAWNGIMANKKFLLSNLYIRGIFPSKSPIAIPTLGVYVSSCLCAKRYVHSVSTRDNDQFKLNPWFITGFVDAEGCFTISLVKDPRYKAGYRVEAIFSISLHSKDSAVLELIQTFFGGAGNIKFETKREVVSYVIRAKDQISKVLLPHFDVFPLATQKRADYLLFKQAFELISNDAHLTPDGLNEIVGIKAYLNLGLSSKLKDAFPSLPLRCRDIITDQEIPNPYWITGFTSGEGSFYVKISQSSSIREPSTIIFLYYSTYKG